MAERGGTRPGQSDDVTASEAATYAFGAKAWHLERVLGRGHRRRPQDGVRVGSGNTGSMASRWSPGRAAGRGRVQSCARCCFSGSSR